MHGKLPSKLRRVIPILLVLALAGAGYWWLRVRPADGNGETSASGTIEATEVTVSAETMGRVQTVLVEEGDAVQAGRILVQFDDTLLRAQHRQAEAQLQASQGTLAAAVATAAASQAQLDQVRAGARPQEIAAQKQAVQAAQGRVAAAEAQLAQARGGLRATQAQRSQAVARFTQVKDGARPEALEAALAQYEQAVAAIRQAQAEYDKVAWRADIAAMPQSLALERATLAAAAARAGYESLLHGATAPEIDQASAGVEQAVAGIIQASAVVSQTEASLVTARAGLIGEEARLELLLAGTRPEQVRVVEAQLAAAEAQAQAAAGQTALAEANIALLDEQLARLTYRAPMAGAVLSRAVEPGETALPGGGLVVLADLTRPTVTVYLPEDRYGAIRVGLPAQVSVDSYPGRSFTGTVQRIADKGEFTPRNVQTPAGRRSMVFAVKVAVENPSGELKPGMPADVAFGE